jgi:DNA-binding NarL/FixJ family response regulator
LIRVGILADTAIRARSLADLLSDDDRIQVVSVSVFPHLGQENHFAYLDVLVVASPALVRSLPTDGPPAVVLGDEGEPGWTFREPIRGWLPGNPTSPELSAAISAVVQNLLVLTDTQAKRRFGTPRQHEIEESIGEALTPRELEVLRMLADGLGNKQIGERLGISDHTAKFHVAQILGKLGAGSRAEAVAIGMRRGLVPL